ncbi:hypothetical protein TrVGV298_008004 [Trichoderma virens]|nr:hypothetical protein TrVGV298_008004 [Trichoderma virens]
MYTMKLAYLAVIASSLAATTLAAGFGGCNDPRIDGIGEFNVADGQNLQQNLAQNTISNSPGTEFELKAQQQQNFFDGSAKLCVVNSFLFENTHVALGDVAFAVNFLLGSCGSAGGKFTIQGDSGLNIDKAFWGFNFEGLRKIKKTIDPDDVFWGYV